MTIVDVRNLVKSFGENTILKDINFTINRGDCVSIIGHSGCGKSTVLRCLNMLETPNSGSIYINGNEITAKNAPLDQIRRSMGMVYQNFNLFSHKTVLENVMMAPMLVKKLKKNESFKLAMDCLAQVGMTERADFMPSQLSGGQKQRAAIARCIAMKPEIMLFDEPTSALDPTMVDEVLSVIRRLINNGMTCVIVTHEMRFAKSVSSKIIYLDDNGIYETGTPIQIFEAPQKPKTKAFIQRIKSFNWQIKSRQFDIYSMNSALGDFCHRQSIDGRKIRQIELLLEEVLIHFLLPKMKTDDVDIDITMEFQEKINSIDISISYSGACTNAVITDDDLSITIIKSLSKNIIFNDNLIKINM